jgi:diguanylate cyclase (GGDEF)-like protein
MGSGREAVRRRWPLVVCALLLGGIAASLAAAALWRSAVQERERESFQTRATDVSARLEMQLRRDTDFVRTVRTLLTMEPALTPSGFAEWARRLEESGHEAEGTFGALVVKAVPASALAAFLARRDADPAFRRLVGGEVLPVPRTGRPRYCLLAAGSTPIASDATFSSALQEDWCDPSTLIGGYSQNGITRAHFTQEVTESGEYAIYAVHAPFGITTLALEAAVYRRGTPLATPAQRRAAVSGWVVGSFDISTLIRAAIGGRAHVAVTLEHVNQGLRTEYIGGGGAAGAQPLLHRATLPLDGTWIISVTGQPAVSGPSADLQGLVVLIVALIATLLLVTLVVVLARARERALAMVREKTAELEHQALHDALTGLPNRVLALDRAEQMLARARRRGQPVAALFVDVDGFKQVNDSLGHAAGDELLRTVGARLEGVVREGETAARFGGDEFVVFMEGARPDGGPDVVGQRLLETLREPAEASAGKGEHVPFTVSIGIAAGLHADVDELLREADIALYRAKAEGKNRCVVFDPEQDTGASVAGAADARGGDPRARGTDATSNGEGGGAVGLGAPRLPA